MKMFPNLLVVTGMLPWMASAAVLIPDGDVNGVSDTLNVSTRVTEIGAVSVTLTFSGGFNGDLYVTLAHDNSYAVLLNRVGRTAANDFGYSDSGFVLTLADGAANGDVHNYRLTLLGSQTAPLGGPLTGMWRPDGRAVDPDVVFDTSAQTATLTSFQSLNPNGEWTLFMADLSSGGQSQLESWSVDITPVPEPAWCGLGMALGALAVALLRGRWVKRR